MKKNWKEKFTTKYEANKEIQKLKHSQKIELEQVKQNKKSWIEKRAEEKRKNKELEHKQFMQGMFILIGMVIFFTIIAIIASILGI